jgi:lactoylglutathione lyase
MPSTPFITRSSIFLRRPPAWFRYETDERSGTGGRPLRAHLTVGDLDRSAVSYRDVVGLPLALEAPAIGAAFFWVGGPGEAMLGLWTLGSAPMGLSLHVAFETSLENVLGASERLRSSGVTPLSFYAAETSEPTVIGWMPAAAVYFRDPDGHPLEYAAMLDSPPDPEGRIVALSQWTA